MTPEPRNVNDMTRRDAVEDANREFGASFRSEVAAHLAEKTETVCQEADRIVSTERQEDYGHPLDDFDKVCEAARAMGIDPTSGPHHHALYMILVKIARELNNPKRDNRVDIAGYAKTADMVITELERRESDPLYRS